MDGDERRVGLSLQTRLSLWLGAAIVVGALLAAVATYYAAYANAIELQDDQLRQLAVLVSRYEQHEAGLRFAGKTRRRDPETQFVVEELPDTSVDAIASGPLAGLHGGLPEGLQTVRPAKMAYRIVVQPLVSGGHVVVGQRTAVRGELARVNARQAVLPLVLLIPALMLMSRVIVRRTFRPVGAVADELDRRDDEDLHPLAQGRLPIEVWPFVQAINRLFGRVDRTLAEQRRFVADAAHELRTPLAALSLQAERLGEAPMSEAARQRLGTLQLGIERSKNLIQQLLALARAQDKGPTPQRNLSVHGVFREVLEELLPLAERKAIDIGVLEGPDACVRANETDLRTLVRNLVDNAIRYVPVGGRIDLAASVDGDAVVLEVRDNGPGIAPRERERVFDPFYRVPGSTEVGSGLGLSIVQSIANRLHAQLQLSDAGEGEPHGLRVTVRVPMDRSQPLGRAGPVA